MKEQRNILCRIQLIDSEIEISVTGKYKELKDVSISDIRKIADKKRKEMKEKVEKLSTEI